MKIGSQKYNNVIEIVLIMQNQTNETPNASTGQKETLRASSLVQSRYCEAKTSLCATTGKIIISDSFLDNFSSI